MSRTDGAAGEDGYLIEKGLIPLHEAELGKAQEAAATLKAAASATP
jgi:hypothetical protein